MEKSININITNGNLGDALLMTALFKNNRFGVINCLDLPKERKLIDLFYGLNTEVRYSSSLQPIFADSGLTHISQQYLDYFQIKDSNCIPQINVNPDDLEWAKNYISQYPNPLVVITNNNGTGDKTNYWAHYRTFNPVLMSELLQEYGKKYTLLHFGLSRNFNKLHGNDIDSFIKMPNCIDILDLPISKLAACYKVIGKYIGGDTGDYHLMLAVGGKCNVLVNENHDLGYPHKSYLYTERLWKDEKVRLQYIPFKDYRKSLEYIDFNY